MAVARSCWSPTSRRRRSTSNVQAQVLDAAAPGCAAHGLAIVLVTHDLGVVAGIADRVAVMYAWPRRRAGARPRRCLRRPRHPYTAALLRSVPRVGRAPWRARSRPSRDSRRARERSLRGLRLRSRAARSASGAVRGERPLLRSLIGRGGGGLPRGPAAHERSRCCKVEGLCVDFPRRGGWPLARREPHRALDGSASSVAEGGCTRRRRRVGRPASRRWPAPCCGLVRPRTGRICGAASRSIAADRATMRRCGAQMQVVFQDPFGSLDPRMTAGAERRTRRSRRSRGARRRRRCAGARSPLRSTQSVSTRRSRDATRTN